MSLIGHIFLQIKRRFQMENNQPKVGIGVIIENSDGEILIGKRKGSHSPYYSIPGGHLELGETFEEAAVREIKEETDLSIKTPKVYAVTNNLRTYSEEGVHYISICLYTDEFEGTLKNLEPEKCEGWQWVNPSELPLPHFDASEQAVKCYLEKRFYLP